MRSEVMFPSVDSARRTSACFLLLACPEIALTPDLSPWASSPLGSKDHVHHPSPAEPPCHSAGHPIIQQGKEATLSCTTCSKAHKYDLTKDNMTISTCLSICLKIKNALPFDLLIQPLEFILDMCLHMYKLLYFNFIACSLVCESKRLETTQIPIKKGLVTQITTMK